MQRNRVIRSTVWLIHYSLFNLIKSCSIAHFDLMLACIMFIYSICWKHFQLCNLIKYIEPSSSFQLQLDQILLIESCSSIHLFNFFKACSIVQFVSWRTGARSLLPALSHHGCIARSLQISTHFSWNSINCCFFISWCHHKSINPSAAASSPWFPVYYECTQTRSSKDECSTDVQLFILN